MSERRGPARPLLAFRVVTEVIGVDASGRLLTARKVVGVDTPLPDVRRCFRPDADYFDAPFF